MTLPDWEERLLAGHPLVREDLPLFAGEAARALRIFRRLRLPDVPGTPSFADAEFDWLLPVVAALFGSYDPDAKRRMIQEAFLLVPKKNGKALDVETPVPTPEGWRQHGDLKAGDLIFDPCGQPRRVLGVTPAYEGDCYRVDISDGTSLVAHARHEWKTLRSWYTKRRRGSRVALPLVETEEIAKTLRMGPDGDFTHGLDNIGPLALADSALPIPPYTFGAWLGDGHSSSARITCADQEIIAAIRAEGIPARQVAGNLGAAKTYSLASRDEADLRFGTRLRQLGVFGHKRIPTVYLRSSIDQRRALLAGIVDTDGHVTPRGQCEIVTIHDGLAADIRELIRSLGRKATSRRRRVRLHGRDLGFCHRIQFWPIASELPVKVPRKAKCVRDKTAVVRHRRIVGCEPVGPRMVNCIEVEGEMYLAGTGMVPTHNSTGAAGIMLTAMIMNSRPAAEGVLVAPTKEIADITYGQAAGMIRLDPWLAAKFHPTRHQRTITDLREGMGGGKVMIKAADVDVVTGGKQTYCLIDETHVFAAKSSAAEVFVELRGALAARPDGFLMQITTQSKTPPAGVFKSELRRARMVRDGTLDLPLLPVLYELPERLASDWKERKYWHIVNPNLGRSVDEAFLERELRSAEEEGPQKLALIASQHFNVQIGLGQRGDRWVGADFWEARGDPELTLAVLLERCEVVVVGIDGGGLDDLFGMAVLGRERDAGEGGKRWLLWSHGWCHEGVLERRKSIAPVLRDFAKAGELSIVDDALADLSEIVAHIEAVHDKGLLACVAVDPAAIGELVDELKAIGITEENGLLVGVKQGMALMSAIKTAERRLANGTLLHGGSGLMGWNVSNVKIEPLATSIRATKQNAGDAKIDLAMAMFDAVDQMSRNPEANSGRSYLEDEDLLVM